MARPTRAQARWNTIVDRWFAPPLTAAEIHRTLAAMTTTGLTKTVMYRTLWSPRPIWDREWERLTRTIMVDWRVVTATHAASDMTWAEVGARCTLYSAQVCVEGPGYFGDGYTNEDPTNVAQDAAYLALVTTRFTHIKNAADTYGFTVRRVMLDVEAFSAVQNSDPDTGGRQAWNTALNLKFSQLYDIPKGLFGTNDNPTNPSTAATVAFYGKGAIRPESSQNFAMTLPNCSDASGADSPAPWGGGWGPEAWNINPYDTDNMVAPYTPGLVTPYIGDAICPVLYYPNEPWTIQTCQQWSRNWVQAYDPGLPIIPYLSMGQSRGGRTFDDWTGDLLEFDYSVELSKMYGAMYDNSPYWSTQVRSERWWYQNTDIVLWPAPTDTLAPTFMNHAIEFLRGMKT